MKLRAEPFEMIKSGKKIYELRLYDEKRRLISAGDTVEFTNTEGGDILIARVAALHRFPDFARLYDALPLTECGYTEENVHLASPRDMESYYSAVEQEKYGVLAIELASLMLVSALPEDAERIYSLYKSAIGTEFCTWNEAYPSMYELRHDTETNNLYVIAEHGSVIGALSVVPENELDGFEAWRSGTARELARVVIAPEHRGRGLALLAVGMISDILRASGFAVHLSVATSNIPACRTYLRLGFSTVGEAELYGGKYYLMELEK